MEFQIAFWTITQNVWTNLFSKTSEAGDVHDFANICSVSGQFVSLFLFENFWFQPCLWTTPANAFKFASSISYPWTQLSSAVFNRMTSSLRDNKKYFYKYINNKKRDKENLHPLLDAQVGGTLPPRMRKMLRHLMTSLLQSLIVRLIIPRVFSPKTSKKRWRAD